MKSKMQCTLGTSTLGGNWSRCCAHSVAAAEEGSLCTELGGRLVPEGGGQTVGRTGQRPKKLFSPIYVFGWHMFLGQWMKGQ